MLALLIINVESIIQFIDPTPNSNNMIESTTIPVGISYFGNEAVTIEFFVLLMNGDLVSNKAYNISYPSGGDVTINGNVRIHSFKNLGTSSFKVPSLINLTYLVVAGGGGGGYASSFSAGGGGAGGFIINSKTMFPGTYTVKVGNGGFGSTTNSNSGSRGENSEFASIVAYGGGGGSSGLQGSNDPAILPTSGGSGGGGGGQVITSSRTNNGASGTNGQGNNGGNGKGDNSNVNKQSGGGGGGAGGAGQSGEIDTAGHGGVGKEYMGKWYSGGGGGGKRTLTGVAGSGGSGVGGNGGQNNYGDNGKPNTGGGGISSNGGNGGSGIVLVTYNTYIDRLIYHNFTLLSGDIYNLTVVSTSTSGNREQISRVIHLNHPTIHNSFKRHSIGVYLIITVLF